MTDLIPTRRIRDVDVIHLPNNRAALRGPFVQVGQVIEGLRLAGELVSATPPQEGEPGVYTSTVRLLPPVQRVPERRRQRGARFWGIVTAAGLAALAALIWAAVALVQGLSAAADHAATAAAPAVEGVWHGALGAVVVIGAVVVAVGFGVRKTFTFSGKGSMD